MKGFTNKQPKIVAGSAHVITRILKYFYTISVLLIVCTLYILLVIFKLA